MKKFNYKPRLMSSCDFLGTDIETWAKQALGQACKENRLVKFQFNDILINVTPGMSVSEILNNYHRKYDYECYLYQNSDVARKNQMRDKLRDLKEQHRVKIFLDTIAHEEFKVTYPYFYAAYKKQNDSDMYSAMTIRYAEQWAKLMQIEMKAGKKLTKKLIDRTSDAADTGTMSNNSFFWAVRILVSCWAHGRTLGKLMDIHIDTVRDDRWYACVQNARLAKVK